LQFKIDDAEDDWVFPQKFDYIHGRTLATCFKEPLSVFKKAFEALAPGGWFEMQDMYLQTSDDGSMEGSALKEWQKVSVPLAKVAFCCGSVNVDLGDAASGTFLYALRVSE
jgi:hypothetical protein